MTSNDKIGCQKTIINFTDAQLTNNLSVCKICTSNIFFSERRFVPVLLTRETVRFLFPPEVEKSYDTKIYTWGKIFFLLRQEDNRCTGSRIGLCHYCFYCVRFLFPPEVEKSYDTKIYFWGKIFFFIAA